MEDILLSVYNGQWKQAVSLIRHSNYDIVQVCKKIQQDEFMDDNTIPRLLAVALSEGYLQVHSDYDSNW